MTYINKLEGSALTVRPQTLILRVNSYIISTLNDSGAD